VLLLAWAPPPPAAVSRESPALNSALELPRAVCGRPATVLLLVLINSPENCPEALM
jgi:hypothetical protein